MKSKIILLLFLSFPLLASIKDIEFINREYALDSKYLPQLIDFSLKYDIRIETLHNWIMAESSGNEKAYNRRSGDKGLCQLHNVRYLVKKYWQPLSDSKQFNVWDGEHNLFIGLAYLSDLITTFGTHYGFMAYNIGRGRIARGEILECGKAYVAKILPVEEITIVRAVKYIGDNSRLILTFGYQELFDDRRQRV